VGHGEEAAPPGPPPDLLDEGVEILVVLGEAVDVPAPPSRAAVAAKVEQETSKPASTRPRVSAG
jgi:hypothetical protein